jgi:hypothetical protein
VFGVFLVEFGVFSDIPPAASTMIKSLRLSGSCYNLSLSSLVDLPAMAWWFPVLAGGGQRLEEEARASYATKNRRWGRFPDQRR